MALKRNGMAMCAVLFAASTSAAIGAPRLQLSTVALGPILVSQGGSNQQTVEAYNAGDGNLNLSVQSLASWLNASVGASRACTTRSGNCLPINISLQPGSQGLGTYTEFLTVSDPNAVDAPQEVSVTITVGGVPDSVTVYGAPATLGNSSPAYALIYPTSQVSGTVNTQSGGSWLQFTLTGGGSFSFGTAYSIQATALSAMAPGTYNGSVALKGSSAAAENKTVGVTFNVTSAPIIQVPVARVRIAAAAGGTGTAAVAFTNVGQGTLGISGATVTPTTGSAPAGVFSATASGSTVTITANPGSLAPGLYGATLTINSNAANNSQVSVPVSLTVEPAGPVITQGGVINIATYQQESLAQGGLAAVYGDQLAPAGTSASSPGVPLATTVSGIQVLVNGVAAPLFYVSPGQINFQVPYEVAAGSTATVQVVSGAGRSNLRSMQVVAQIPRIMPWPTYLVPGNYGIVVNYADGSLVLPTGNQLPGFKSHPAKPGDLLIIYCLGLGPTSPGATTGAAGAAQAVPNVTVTFGGGFFGIQTTVTPLFAGLSGGVGLYQTNVYVPTTVTPGATVPVTLSVNGVVSNFVTIPVSTTGQ